MKCCLAVKLQHLFSENNINGYAIVLLFFFYEFCICIMTLHRINNKRDYSDKTIFTNSWGTFFFYDVFFACSQGNYPFPKGVLIYASSDGTVLTTCKVYIRRCHADKIRQLLLKGPKPSTFPLMFLTLISPKNVCFSQNSRLPVSLC